MEYERYYKKFGIKEITDAWLINKKTGEIVLHLDQSVSDDTSWASTDKFRLKYIKDKEDNF